MCKEDCGCTRYCTSDHSWRRFRTREEKTKRLKEYRKELEKELDAVKTRLDELE